MNRLLALLFLFSISLSACGVAPSITDQPLVPSDIPYISTTPNAIDTPITGSSSPTDIQLRMRVSHLFWDTVWMDATITYYDEHSPNPTEQKHQQAWVDRENFTFRVESGKVDEKPTFFQVCDGETIIRYDSKTAILESTPMPPSAKNPFNPWMDSKDTVYPYPLALEITTPLSDMIFPTATAQNTDEIRIIGEEIIAERPVVVVDRFVGDGIRPTRMWVDGQTGMLLKRQDFSKDDPDLLVAEYLVNQVIFDTQFDISLFSTDIDTNPIFESYDAVPPTDLGEPTISDLPMDTVIPGNLYYVVSDQTGTINLVRQSASCVFQITACPEANPIAGYPNVNGYINPLIWSPTGEKAALVITSNNGEPLDQLYLFDPVENTWEILASYQSINTPAWSNDGKTIYIVANSNQATNVIAVPITVGMPSINLTEGYFSEENAALTISGWLENRLFVSHALAGRGLEYLSLSPTKVDVKPVDILPSARYIAVPSPKQNFIAMAGYSEDESMELTIRDIEHGSDKLVESFANSGISSLLWTPDNQWVIFEINTMLSSDTLTASIYAVRPDGSDLRLLYSNAGGNRLVPSSDSKYLLLQTYTEGSKIYLLSLDSENPIVVQALGIPEGSQVEGVSWQQSPE